MTDQPNDSVRFLMFFATCMLVVLVAQGVGLMIGAYFDVVVSIYPLVNKFFLCQYVYLQNKFVVR